MKALLFVLFLLVCTAVSAFAGNELGNGGDLVAQEFTSAARSLLEQLREKPDSRIPDLEKLKDAIDTVKVTSAGHLTLHGAEVDAINYPEQKEIDVNRLRWEASDPEKRASLVLHEYLGIIQVTDLHYEISSSYAAPFAAPAEKPKKFEAGLGTAYGWNRPFKAGHTHSTEPGLTAHLGYEISRRSALLLQFDRQIYGYNDDTTSYSESYKELTLGWKYWLNDAKTWHPYVQANAGYVWRKSDFSFVDSTFSDEEIHFRDNNNDRNFSLQLGAGVRYSLLKDVGLDLGVMFHSVGSPWEWESYSQKQLSGHAGVDVIF